MELTEAVYKLGAGLPADERYGLTSQMKRAVASIPMNLAEGYGRGGREFVRFIKIAYGSLLELETAIDLARRLGMVSDVTVFVGEFDTSTTDGPCRKLLMKTGRMSLQCEFDAAEFSLDEPSQGSLAVRVTTGAGPARREYCAVFDSEIAVDEPGHFRAANAPAPIECPFP